MIELVSTSRTIEGEKFGVRAATASPVSAPELLVADIWPSLTHSRLRIMTCERVAGNAVMVLELLAAPRPPLETRSVRILERLLSGVPQKVCADELGVSLATISTTAKRAVRAMGLTCGAARLPFTLFWLAHVSHQRGRRALAPGFRAGDAWCFKVNAPEPSALIAPSLTAAQRAVMSLLMDGLPYTDIARARATATRTVANQIAAAFRTLRISGRGELLAMLASRPAAELLYA